MARSPGLTVCAVVTAGSCADVAASVSDRPVVGPDPIEIAPTALPGALPAVVQRRQRDHKGAAASRATSDRTETKDGAAPGQCLELFGASLADQTGSLHEADTGGYFGRKGP